MTNEVMFSSPFDAALARNGPAAVFLQDADGAWRFDGHWTRDAWGREPGPHTVSIHWRLLRDHSTGYVTFVLVTSPTLLMEHPRADVRSYDDPISARQARAAFGNPPLCREPW